MKYLVPALILADQVLEIVYKQSWQLRYPVGTDVKPFLAERAPLTDEQWMEWNAAIHKDWFMRSKVLLAWTLNKAPKLLGHND